MDISEKFKNEFGNPSAFYKRNLLTEMIADPIVNFLEPFSWGIHSQNKFLEPVQYGTYVSLPQNDEVLRPATIRIVGNIVVNCMELQGIF